MLEFELNEFIETIVSELSQYDDITSEQINQWEAGFLDLVKNNKVSKKNLKVVNNSYYIMLSDEIEVFAIVDDYITAIEDNDFQTYWDTFL